MSDVAALHAEKVSAALERNVQRVLKDGPGLRYSTEVVVLARDRTAGKVLLGGLGGMGVGEMWRDERDFPRYTGDEMRDYSRYCGYEDAPEETCPPNAPGRLS